MPAPCQAPRYEADLRLAELQTPELFLTTLLRLRELAESGGAAAHDWREGLAALRCRPQGVAAFDQLFREISGGVVLALNPLRHPRLSTDEAQLLRFVSLLQHRRFAEAELLVASWLPPAVARRALRDALQFAEHLGAAGLVIPLRYSAVAGIDLLARQLLPARGLLLVH